MARRPEAFSELGLRPPCLVAAPPPGGLSQPSMGPVQVPTHGLSRSGAPCRSHRHLWAFSQVWPPGTLPRTGLLSPSGAPHSPPGGVLCRGGETPPLQRRRNSRPLAGARQGSPFETPGALLGQGRSVPKWHGGLRTLVGSPRAPTCPGRPGRAAGGGGGGSESEVCQGPFGRPHPALQPVTASAGAVSHPVCTLVGAQALAWTSTRRLTRPHMHVHGLAVDATVATQRWFPSEAPKTMPCSLLCWTLGSRRGPQGHQCLPVPVWAKMSPSWTPLHLALSICPSPAARICAACPWPPHSSLASPVARQGQLCSRHGQMCLKTH